MFIHNIGKPPIDYQTKLFFAAINYVDAIHDDKAS
jgi:hypothetical protein